MKGKRNRLTATLKDIKGWFKGHKTWGLKFKLCVQVGPQTKFNELSVDTHRNYKAKYFNLFNYNAEPTLTC